MMVEAIGSDADHLVVQAMTTPGVDLRIHCEHDERLGVIVSVGLGGAQADVIADRTSRLAPVSPSVASTMLDETRIRARCWPTSTRRRWSMRSSRPPSWHRTMVASSRSTSTR